MPKIGRERTPGAGKRGDLWGESGAEELGRGKGTLGSPAPPVSVLLEFYR